MSEFAALHLKLDGIARGQLAILAAQREQDETMRMFGAGLSNFADGQTAIRELLLKIVDKLSEETGGQELSILLANIEKVLAQLQIDTARMVEVLLDLPDVVERAAQDGAVFAIGERPTAS